MGLGASFPTVRWLSLELGQTRTAPVSDGSAVLPVVFSHASFPGGPGLVVDAHRGRGGAGMGNLLPGGPVCKMVFSRICICTSLHFCNDLVRSSLMPDALAKTNVREVPTCLRR
jgi:hypothetical protein